MNTNHVLTVFNEVKKKNAWGINNITQRHERKFMPVQSELLSVFLRATLHNTQTLSLSGTNYVASFTYKFLLVILLI